MNRLIGSIALAAVLAGPLHAPLLAQPQQGDTTQNDGVGATILPGSGQVPIATPPADRRVAAGDVTLNFPGVDARSVAKAVLGGILNLPYSIDPALEATVTVVTDRPIARSAVLPFLEGAFRAANLAIVNSNGTYIVTTVEQARVQAGLVGPDNSGFGNELFRLEFIGAAPMKQLIESILPGVVSSIDTQANTITVAGTAGQRRAVRDLLKSFDVNWLRNMSFALYVPKRTDARLIVPELEKLIDSPGAPTQGLVKLIAMERLNGILAVSSQPQYLEDVRRWVEILDKEGQNNEPRIFVYRVQNGRSSDLAKTLLGAFGMASGKDGNRSGSSDAANPFATATDMGSRPQGSGMGGSMNGSMASGNSTASGPGGANNAAGNTTGLNMTISSDEANNAVIVYGNPQTYAIVEDALRKLDLPPMQVLIEVAIAEVTLNDKLSYGVQWLFRDRGNDIALTEGSTNIPTRVFPGLSLGYSNGGSIQATLNALEGLTNVEIVSSPKLLVINNQTASLQVGDQVPVTTASALSTESASAPIVNSVEYRDTGVILKITPRVNSGGLVLLDIAQEVSDVSETSSSNIDSPTISTRRLASSIAVQDNQTIALGGLIRAAKTRGNSGIPLLSRIPILGALFGTKSNNDRKTELLVLLRPRVIRDMDEGRAITEELREKIRTVKPGTPGFDL